MEEGQSPKLMVKLRKFLQRRDAIKDLGTDVKRTKFYAVHPLTEKLEGIRRSEEKVCYVPLE